MREFALTSIGFALQQQYPVDYKGFTVGKLIPDLIVEDKVIVDTKVVTAFNESHSAQMLGYMAITEPPFIPGPMVTRAREGD